MIQLVIDQWFPIAVVATLVYLVFDYVLPYLRAFGKHNDGVKYVLITGCDSGFGHDSALVLSGDGCHVLAGCLTQIAADELQADPAFKGTAFKMDVTKKDDIKKSVEIVKEALEGKGLHAVVNNAGILSPGPIDWQTEEAIRNIMDINCFGTVMVTKAMLPFLKRGPDARIVNVSSMAGRVLLAYGTTYCMSKFAVEAFSDGLRYEMKPYGISVHIIEPGMFRTKILSPTGCSNQIRSVWDQQSEETKEEYGGDYVNELCCRYNDLIEKIASTKTEKVASAIKHAVLSYNPRKRYVIGFDGHTIWMAIATLPTCIGDWILSTVSPALVPRGIAGGSKSDKKAS